MFQVLGAGGHARSIAAALETTQTPCVLTQDKDVVKFDTDSANSWILGVGSLTLRRKWLERMSSSFLAAAGSVVHPTAHVSKTSVCGRGVFVGAGAYVGPAASLGAHDIINTGAIVEHDCELGENVHVAIGAKLCGGVKVGHDVLIGAGAIILPRVTVGEGAIVGAGAVVTKDVPLNETWVGVPAYEKLSTSKDADQDVAAAVEEEEKQQQQQPSSSSLLLPWVAPKQLNALAALRHLRHSERAGWYTNGGPASKLLEVRLRDLLAIPREAAVCAAASGTAALHALMAAHNIKAGRRLRWATQAFTFPTSAQGPASDALILDNDACHHGPSLAALQAAAPRIDGVIVTNLFGTLCDLDVYVEWCRAHGKLLLLDNAATPRTFYKGRNSCLTGDGAIVSLHETKPLGRGEGGVVVCLQDLEPFVRRAMNFGFVYGNAPRLMHVEASNWRMSDIAAAFIMARLDLLGDDAFAACDAAYAAVEQVIGRSSNVDFLVPRRHEAVYPACVLLRTSTPIDVEEVSRRTGAECKRYYLPLSDEASAPVAWNWFRHVLCVPFSPARVDVMCSVLRHLDALVAEARAQHGGAHGPV